MIRLRHVASMLLCTISLVLATAIPAQPPSDTALATAHAQQAPSGVWYEIFVRSWYDSNGDGIGDLNGVTAKLDYLQSLGVSGIWLMPINTSPSYHGYDVTDYYGINPQYGTLADFQHLLVEAHKRGIKVIMDLVINHSSSEHPWFKDAANPASPYHAWYQWSKPDTNLDAISATGGPAWHALGKEHYKGIFTAEMPDLNFDNPDVRQQMIRIGRYWLKQGVDGFRLDAAQHIYFDFKDQRDDPQVLAKNLAWWSAFRMGLDPVDPHAYIIGEVTRDTPEELAPYFKSLSAVFDFPLALQLIDSAKTEQVGKLGHLLSDTDAAYRKVTGKSGVDAPFLSNHDQERVMSTLANNPQHMRMAAAMLLTLPGQPFLYYGEELGMRGQKPDEDLREPMRWQREPHATGTSRWKDFSAGDSPTVSVQAEQADQHSLLHDYTTLISWRREISTLRDGDFSYLDLHQPQVAAWELRDAHSQVIVLHNLGASAQTVDLHSLIHPASHLLKQSGNDASLRNGTLQLPAYSSAILD